MDTAEKLHGTLTPVASAQAFLRRPILRAVLALGIFAAVMHSTPLLAQAEHPQLLTSVRTEKGVYRPGERVRIIGKVLDITGAEQGGLVELQVVKQEAGQEVKQPTEQEEWSGTGNGLSPRVYRVRLGLNGADFWDAGFTNKPPAPRKDNIVYRVTLGLYGSDFWDDGFIIPREPRKDKRGQSQYEHYIVKARAHSQGSSAEDEWSSEAPFTAEESSWLLIGLLCLVPISLAVLLSVFMMAPTKRAAGWSLLLVFISGLCFLGGALLMPALISSSPNLEADLRTTPIGIAKVTTNDWKNLQWALNIGGTIKTNPEKPAKNQHQDYFSVSLLQGGFAVPLFVFTLGLVGAVINMLMKFPECLHAYDKITPGAANEAEKVSELRGAAFRYFIYILTGPFLGIIVYSLVAMTDYSEGPVLSIMAFSVGFIADRIVEKLLTVAGRILDLNKSGHEQEQSTSDNTRSSPGRPPSVGHKKLARNGVVHSM
jgi:hypothetical protein